MSLYQMLTSCSEQLPNLTHSRLLGKIVMEKSVQKATPVDLGWTGNPKAANNSPAQLQRLCSLTQWARPIGNSQLQVSARRFWASRLQLYGLAIQGPWGKWSNRRRQERKGEGPTEQRPHNLWERSWLHSQFSSPLCWRPGDPAVLCFTGSESFQGAAQIQWLENKVPKWPPGCESGFPLTIHMLRTHSLSLVLLSRMGITTLFPPW